VSAHAHFLQLQGQNKNDVDLIGTNAPEGAKLFYKERVLLEFVKTLTLEPAKMSDVKVQKLRNAGWSDNEIFEASFITSLFAFFNRMADAYGLDYSPDRWMPPDMRRAVPTVNSPGSDTGGKAPK